MPKYSCKVYLTAVAVTILSILSNAVGMLSLMAAAADIIQSIMSILPILSNAVGMLSSQAILVRHRLI